jgi:glutathione S-transferase
MLTLVIGNKELSSWSLRPWLILKHYGLPFSEIKLPLDTPEFFAQIVKYTSARRVPVLLDGEAKIWDSLAIVEYLNEKLGGRAWPADPLLRAHARSVSAEMHSGFMTLRPDLADAFDRQQSARAAATRRSRRRRTHPGNLG